MYDRSPPTFFSSSILGYGKTIFLEFLLGYREHRTYIPCPDYDELEYIMAIAISSYDREHTTVDSKVDFLAHPIQFTRCPHAVHMS